MEPLTPDPPPSRVKFAALVIAALLLAVTPLVAQYERQRGLAGDVDAMTFAPLVEPHALAAASFHVARPAVHRRLVHRGVHARANRRIAYVRPAPHVARIGAAAPKRRVAMRPRRHRRSAHAVLAAWKFSPQNNPYVAGRHFVRVRSRARAFAVSDDPRAADARRVVTAYLNGVIHGNVFGAPEADIVSPLSRVHVLRVRPTYGNEEEVAVRISGPRGTYVETFFVAADSMRIVDHSYQPAP